MNTLVYDMFAACFFGVWFVATVLRQMHIEPAPAVIAKSDTFSLFSWLIPIWHFFAPTPGNYNIYLLYRYQMPNDALTNWIELPILAQGRVPKLFWNPSKLRSKAMIDIVNELSIMSSMYSEHIEYLTISIPYLMLLNHVNSITHWNNAIAVQFVVMKKTKEQDSVILLSGLHEIGR